jgi:hypothetical protein
MHRIAMISAVATCVLLAVLSLARVSSSAVELREVARVHASPTSDCSVTNTLKVAAPSEVVLGGEVGIALHLETRCEGRYTLAHSVLVLDGSSDMAGSTSREMRLAAKRIVQALELNDYPSAKGGSGRHVAWAERRRLLRGIGGSATGPERWCAPCDRVRWTRL